MSTTIDDVIQKSLFILRGGQIVEKRHLLHILTELRLDVSFMTLDMTLAQLRQAGLIYNVDVSTVQITKQGSQILDDEIVVTREYLQTLAGIAPAQPKLVNRVAASISETATLNKYSQRNLPSPNRSVLFAEILKLSGKPLHYKIIHKQALMSLPPDQHFSANAAYLSLYSSSRFRLLGDGVFALVGWRDAKPVAANALNNKISSRKTLFTEILCNAGKPLHYKAIHKQVLRKLPGNEHFTVNVTYSSLYSDPRFRLLGNGIFTLEEWGDCKSFEAVSSITKKKPSRTALFSQILTDAGRPLHYRDIHEKALQCLPAEEHFSDYLAYISLHGSSRFRLLGEGVFALAEWEHIQHTYFEEEGNRIFISCPRPLLPERSHSRSLFESIVAGIHIAQYYPSLSAKQFIRHMAAWAHRNTLTKEDLQNAFDAWYVVGLLEHIDYQYNTNISVRLELDEQSTLEQIRNHCLNRLCQRLQHTSTILYLVQALPHVRQTKIQQFLRDRDGYRAHINIVDYLHYLEAFEAVRCSGDVWQLTPIGESLLKTCPPREWIDLNVVDEADIEASALDETAWADELGLLDI